MNIDDFYYIEENGKILKGKIIDIVYRVSWSDGAITEENEIDPAQQSKLYKKYGKQNDPQH